MQLAVWRNKAFKCGFGNLQRLRLIWAVYVIWRF